MHAALSSRLSRWWCWLIGQVTPAGESPPPPPPSDAAVAPGAEIIAFPGGERLPIIPRVELPPPDRMQLFQAMLATVQQQDLLLVHHQAATRPIAREQTLAELRALDQIPSLRSLARSFTEAINRDDASVEEVVAAVQRDPALCVRVLRQANSVEISPEERIDDIGNAVQMLGLLRVRKAARALFTLRGAHAVAPGFDWRHLWIHGLATAAIAEELERQLNLPADPHLHLAGLLHDVGKIVLSTIAPEAYREVLIDAWEGTGRLSWLEEARFGVGHSEAGVIFAQHCGLHAGVIGTIAFHADPAGAGEHRLSAALVSVANYVAKAYGLGFSGARLEEADGEFGALPAWEVIRQQMPVLPDLEMLEEDLRAFIVRLKPELAALRDEA